MTNEPVYTPDQAWKIILCYARRWQVEMALRFDKSELGFESLRVFSWEVRLRLFQILALVHAFLLQFLTPAFEELRSYLLDKWCHRTGKRSRETQAPLYRLRFALAFFWSRFPPPFFARLKLGMVHVSSQMFRGFRKKLNHEGAPHHPGMVPG